MAEGATIQTVKRSDKPFAPIDAQTQRAIGRIADSDCPVLIAGERGVGKRSVAAQIHAQSRRARSAFIEIHSADATAERISSALTSGGSLYLVEVGDLSSTLQGLIIQSYFCSDQTRSSRLFCGSSRELHEEVRLWRMGEDFFHLVSAVTLRIPPLRCRKSEIPSLADELLTQYAKQFGRPKPVLRKEIVEFLMDHSWPGNLTEFETAIKTFVAIGDQSISLAALKASDLAANSDGRHRAVSLKEAIRAASIQIERQLISEVLITTGGNRKRAADELGISYKALLYKLKHVTVECQPVSIRNGVAL